MAFQPVRAYRRSAERTWTVRGDLEKRGTRLLEASRAQQLHRSVRSNPGADLGAGLPQEAGGDGGAAADSYAAHVRQKAQHGAAGRPGLAAWATGEVANARLELERIEPGERREIRSKYIYIVLIIIL